MGILKETISAVPVVGQASGFVEVSKVVFNSTSASEAAINGIRAVIIECSPPQIKYPVKCALLVT